MLSKELRDEVERRLHQTHNDRIAHLTERLNASMQLPFSKSSSLLGAANAAAAAPAHALDAAIAVKQQGRKLTDIFDELLASDASRRMTEMTEEMAFRDRELTRLRDALDRTQMEAALAREQREASTAQLSHAANGNSRLEQELRQSQQEQQQLAAQLAAANAARAVAERAAAAAEARAESLEALAASKGQDLADLQKHYKGLLQEQQAELDELQQQLQQAAADRERTSSRAAATEQQLSLQLHEATAALAEARGALAADRAAHDALQQQHAQLAEAAGELRRAKKQLAGSLGEAEAQLAETEADRRALRTKYISLGEKVEHLMQEEAAAKQAAEQNAAALKAAIADAEQTLRSTKAEADVTATALRQERDALAKLLAEAEQKLVEAAVEQRRAVRKVDRKLVHLAQEYDVARQELMVKTAEILDLQNQVREEALRHDASVSAAEDASAVLRHQVAQLQAELDAAAQQEAQAIRQAEADMQLEMKRQQLKYERQIQELELANRCAAALEAFSAPDMGRRSMQDQGLQPNGDAAAMGSPGKQQLLDGFDSRLRRQLAGHVGRVDSLQVAAEEKLVALRKELSGDYQRRLELMEADWKARKDAALAEAEASHNLRVQQLELQQRLEREQHEARVSELSAAKLRLEEALSASRAEAASSAKEAGQLRRDCEELRGTVQLQAGRLEEAQKSINALQGLVGLAGPVSAPGSGGMMGADRDMIAELMARIEARTQERNEAMREAASAEARIIALEAERGRLEQRLMQQQQATQAAESARHELELRSKQAAAELQRTTLALQAADAANMQADAKIRQYEEEKRRLTSSLAQAETALAEAHRQLPASQAEAAQLREQVKELRRAKQRVEDTAAAAEAALKRVNEEKGQLSQAKQELEMRKDALQSQVEEHQDEHRRLSVLVHNLELSKQGLARRITWYGGEGNPVSLAGTSHAGMSHAGMSHAGMSMASSPGRSRHASPSRMSMGGRSAMASIMHDEDVTDVESVIANASSNFQELEGVIARFEGDRRSLEDDRRALADRCESQAAEVRELRSQLHRTQSKAAEQEGALEQLRVALDRQAGMRLEEAQAHEARSSLTNRALGDVQRGNAELQQANAQLQEALDAARAADRQAQQQLQEAQQEVAGLQALVNDLQRALKATRDDSQEQSAQRLQQLSALVQGQLGALRDKVGSLEAGVKQEVAQAARECTGQLEEVDASWHAKLEATQLAHKAELERSAAKHHEAITQLGQQLALAADEAKLLREAQDRLQGQLLAARLQLGQLLELQGAQDASAALAASTGAAADADVEALAADVRGALLAALQQEASLAEAREALLLERQGLLVEREGLLLRCPQLEGDLQLCATNLQSVVSVVAFSVPLDAEAQQGLNAKDPEVFDAHLQELHEALTDYVEAQRQEASKEAEVQLQTGAIAELTQQTECLQEELTAREREVADLKAEAEASLIKFDDSLVKCRVECMEAAEAARQEAVGALKAEVAALKSNLQELQEAHAAELSGQQDGSNKQLQQHVKTADRIIRELEGTATSLQAQLAAEVERADAMAAQLKSLQAEQERKLAAEARKERRATGEIEALRSRLRDMEARQAEKEDELKALKRSLRQKELSLLGNNVSGDR